MDIRAYWKAVISQDRAALSAYFREDAVIRWHCTNERFTAAEYIRANCEYPNEWDGEIERIEENDDCIILAGCVFPKDRSASFHVVSFIRTQNDVISEMDEYWADDGEAPEWRREMNIGKPICQIIK